MALDSEAKRKAVPGAGRPWLRVKKTDAATGEDWRVSTGSAYPVASFAAAPTFQPAWAHFATTIAGVGPSGGVPT